MSEQSHSAAEPTAPQIELDLEGRFMLATGKEFACRVIQLSTQEMVLSSVVTPNIGERIILYARGLGRFEGIVTRLRKACFAIGLHLSAQKTDRLSYQCSRLQSRRPGATEAPIPRPAPAKRWRIDLGLSEAKREERLVQTRDASFDGEEPTLLQIHPDDLRLDVASSQDADEYPSFGAITPPSHEFELMADAIETVAVCAAPGADEYGSEAQSASSFEPPPRESLTKMSSREQDVFGVDAAPRNVDEGRLLEAMKPPQCEFEMMARAIESFAAWVGPTAEACGTGAQSVKSVEPPRSEFRAQASTCEQDYDCVEAASVREVGEASSLKAIEAPQCEFELMTRAIEPLVVRAVPAGGEHGTQTQSTERVEPPRGESGAQGNASKQYDVWVEAAASRDSGELPTLEVIGPAQPECELNERAIESVAACDESTTGDRGIEAPPTENVVVRDGVEATVPPIELGEQNLEHMICDRPAEAPLAETSDTAVLCVGAEANLDLVLESGFLDTETSTTAPEIESDSSDRGAGACVLSAAALGSSLVPRGAPSSGELTASVPDGAAGKDLVAEGGAAPPSAFAKLSTNDILVISWAKAFDWRAPLMLLDQPAQTKRRSEQDMGPSGGSRKDSPRATFSGVRRRKKRVSHAASYKNKFSSLSERVREKREQGASPFADENCSEQPRRAQFAVSLKPRPQFAAPGQSVWSISEAFAGTR
jgi:hypothetical protein